MSGFEKTYRELVDKGTLMKPFTGDWKSDKDLFIKMQLQNESLEFSEEEENDWSEDDYLGDSYDSY